MVLQYFLFRARWIDGYDDIVLTHIRPFLFNVAMSHKIRPSTARALWGITLPGGIPDGPTGFEIDQVHYTDIHGLFRAERSLIRSFEK